jgi:hypothetical protein
MTKYITGISKEDAGAVGSKKPNKVFYIIKYTTDRELWKIYPEVKKICIEFDKALTRALLPELNEKTLSSICIKRNNINDYNDFEFIFDCNNKKYHIYITEKDLYDLLTDIAKEFAVNNIKMTSQSDATITFEPKCICLTSLFHKIIQPIDNGRNYNSLYIDNMINCCYNTSYDDGVIQICHDN